MNVNFTKQVISKISTANFGETKKATIDDKKIAHRKERWWRCVYGAPGWYDEAPNSAPVHCCTNNNIGRIWRLEKLERNLKTEGSSDVYILSPQTNLIECEECSEYKKRRLH